MTSKEQLISLAEKVGFQSTFFDHKEILKEETEEDLNYYYLWCCDLSRWLIVTKGCCVYFNYRECCGIILDAKNSPPTELFCATMEDLTKEGENIMDVLLIEAFNHIDK